MGCGGVYTHKNVVLFRVSKFSDINDKIIAFFLRYPIIGVKAKDLDNFCKVALLINSKAHLTAKGLEEILNIKRGIITNGDKYVIVADPFGEKYFTEKSIGKDCLTNQVKGGSFIQKTPFHNRVKAIKRIGLVLLIW